MALQSAMALEIKQVLDNVSNVAEDAAVLREQQSDALATVMMKYIKLSLQTVIGAGTPIPQDGGAGLKTTMLASINSL